ncbi:MAG: ribbon-helix-helix domain-containing protein [Alphaproteobacteria bacterium]|nr:ribbon-helix-helix domain-containing protein [Alphaproteobacteria bacterium]
MPKEKSQNRQRKNVMLGNRRTSVSLEDQVWDGLTEVCRREEISVDELCTKVERLRVGSSMSSALRVFLMTYFRMLMENLEAPAVATQSGLSEQRAPFSSALEAALGRFQHEQEVALSRSNQ